MTSTEPTTVTLTAGQHVWHDDAIAHERAAAVQEHALTMISWTCTDGVAYFPASLFDDALVERLTALGELIALGGQRPAATADAERAYGRLAVEAMRRGLLVVKGA